MNYWEQNLINLSPTIMPNTISFKLPQNIQFDQLPEFFVDINKILNQLIVNETIQGKVEFNGFESGSSWINVGLGTGTALMIVCNIVNLIYNAREREQKIEAQSLALDELKMNLEAKETVLNVFREQMSILHEEELKSIREKANFPDNDYEMPKRLEYAIQGLEKWINLGLEIHPSLAEPKEIQMQFPDSNPFFESMKRLTLDNETKLLAPGTDEQ